MSFLLEDTSITIYLTVPLQENLRFATMTVLGNLIVENINIISYHLFN